MPTTRDSYDILAATYAEQIGDELAGKPLDRAALAEIAALPGPVLDAGCGPGHVAAHLAGLGADVTGVDLSPGMVEVARADHGAVARFVVGDMTELPFPDGRFGAVVAFYSLIHLPDPALHAALVDLRRVTRAGGTLLAAAHIGTGVLHRDALWGLDIDLDFRLFLPDELAAAIAAAGWRVDRVQERDPYPDVEHPSRRVMIRATSG